MLHRDNILGIINLHICSQRPRTQHQRKCTALQVQYTYECIFLLSILTIGARAGGGGAKSCYISHFLECCVAVSTATNVRVAT